MAGIWGKGYLVPTIVRPGLLMQLHALLISGLMMTMAVRNAKERVNTPEFGRVQLKECSICRWDK